MRVLIATNNPGKRREFQQMLGTSVSVVSMRDLGMSSPPERGNTFEANAEEKARIASSISGLLTVADDSGLEVDALDGAPGVYSARFSGENATDESNRALLLHRLDGVQQKDRRARFVSVVSVCTPDGQCRNFRGEWDGRVGFEERGNGGFGYDSLFQLYDGRAAAELSSAEKNSVSHRAKALNNALPYLRSLIHEQHGTRSKGTS